MSDSSTAFTTGAALIDIAEARSLVSVTGKDAEDYLQRSISGDLRKSTPSQGVPRP